VVGTDFEPLDIENCDVIIGGFNQNIVSMTTTQLVAEVTELGSGTVAE